MNNSNSFFEQFPEDEELDNSFFENFPEEDRKLNNKESIAAGVIESVAGPLHLASKAGEALSVQKPESFTDGIGTKLKLPRETEAELIQKPIEEMSFAEIYALTDDDIIPPSMIRPSEKQLSEASPEAVSPTKEVLKNLPKSETQTGRRLRNAASAGVLTSVFGPLPTLISIASGQVGQTVREIFGEDGEGGFLVESAAFIVDLFTSLGLSIGPGILKESLKNSNKANAIKKISSVFEDNVKYLDKTDAKNIILGEKKALDKVVNDFSKDQIQVFEKEASKTASKPFEKLENIPATSLDDGIQKAYVDAQLNLITPIETTLEEGSRVIQDTTNKIFKSSVIDAEQAAYKKVSQESSKLSGKATETIKLAKKKRAELSSTTPTPDQEQAISFLDTLISDLEHTTPPKKVAGGLDVSGSFIRDPSVIPSSTLPRTRTANDLIKMVQAGNHSINYDSQVRLQSHRLKPVIDMLREETGNVLQKNAKAFDLWKSANKLHGDNAKLWNTKNMRKVRFGENPESIIKANQTGSNLRNFKQATQNEYLSDFTEKMVIKEITDKGSSKSNNLALNKLQPSLSPRAHRAAKNIISSKNPDSLAGGREALKNKLINDAASSILAGKRPEIVLERMRTPKGYDFVYNTFKRTKNGREIFKSMERLFIEDIFESALTKEGIIDFKKANDIFKNKNIQEVVRKIGGNNLVNRFKELEKASIRFNANKELFKNPKELGFIKEATSKIKNAGILTAVMHSFGVPYEVLAGMGLAKGAFEISKIASKKLIQKVASNPIAVDAIRRLSLAKTGKEASKQILRLHLQSKDWEKED